MKDIWFHYFILEPLLLFNSQAHTHTSIKVKKKLLNSSSGPSLGEKYRARTKIKYKKNVFHYTEKEEIKTSKDLQNSKDGPVKHLT